MYLRLVKKLPTAVDMIGIIFILPILTISGLSTNLDKGYVALGPTRDRRCFLSDVLGTSAISLLEMSPGIVLAESTTLESANLWQQSQIFTNLGKSIFLTEELNPLSSPWELFPSENELFYGKICCIEHTFFIG